MKKKNQSRVTGLLVIILVVFIVCFITWFVFFRGELNTQIASTENVSTKAYSNESTNIIPIQNDNNMIDVNSRSNENDGKKISENNSTKSIEDDVSKIVGKGKVIVIDPGHQLKGNSGKEPIGPGATETKAKVTGGATGVATGQTEYQLNLDVSLKLQKALESKGYTVIMTRTSNNVNISNSERAKIANDANADAFIRIHANSADNSSVRGTLTMCQTSSNKYNGNLAAQSYKLSKSILDGIVKETGTVNKGVTKTDTMSGINWSNVPTTIVEMGFMSNYEEDKLMSTEEYQNKIVNGIVDGIEQFLS